VHLSACIYFVCLLHMLGVVTEPKLLKSHPALWVPMISTADIVAVHNIVHE